MHEQIVIFILLVVFSKGGASGIAGKCSFSTILSGGNNSNDEIVVVDVESVESHESHQHKQIWKCK